MNNDAEETADILVEAVYRAVAKNIAPLKETIADLERRLAISEARAPVDLALIARDAAALVPRGTDGLNGKDGIDGKSVEMPEVEPILAEMVDRAVAGFPRPQDGKNGKDGEPGRDGIGVDSDLIKTWIVEQVAEHGKNIRIPRDGTDGEPGRDALQIEILPAIDFERSYPRGTYATHKGGLWRAGETTRGERGWDLILRGIDSIEHQQNAEDFRKATVRYSLSDQTKEFAIHNDSPCWRGQSYKAGDECGKGDIVVFGGSAWIANQQTGETPGTGSEHWTVFARKGRDGKDGEKGQEGKPGRDFPMMVKR